MRVWQFAWLSALLALAFLVFLGFDVWFYRAVQAWNAAICKGSLAYGGCHSRSRWTFDSHGVPTINGVDAERPFLRAGVSHSPGAAVANGHDAAVRLGRPGGHTWTDFVAVDREQRILGLRQAAEQTAAAIGPGTAAAIPVLCQRREIYIAGHTKTLPMEFRFLTYAPHVWTVEDSLLVGLSMTEFLNHGYYRETLLKEKAVAKLGPELAAELFVNSSWRDHPPGSEGKSLADETPLNLPEGEDVLPPPGKGSKPPSRSRRNRLGSRGFCRWEGLRAICRPKFAITPDRTTG